MNRKKISIALFLFLAVVSMVYIRLGGFNEVEFTVIDEVDYQMIGIPFEGRYKSNQVQNIFYQTRELLEQGKVMGTMAIIYEQDPADHDGEMKSFTGIILEQPIQELPDGFQRKNFKANKVVQAKITAHPLVMPNPTKVKERMHNFAEEKGLILEDISLEKMLSERELIVEIPVVDE